MQHVSAFAHINIALIKYWGKSNLIKNIPATPSLSLTLDKFGTKTSLYKSTTKYDKLTINNIKQTGESLKKVVKFIDIFRNLANTKQYLHIISHNNIPTASGLASSASSFAALTIACNKYFNFNLNKLELSRIARFGSASAARSIFGHFVSLKGGKNIKDKKCIGHIVKYPKSLQVSMLIITCTKHRKHISSRLGMNHAAKTSPFFTNFLNTNHTLFKKAIKALKNGSFKKLGATMEHSTLNMHATCLTANPGFWYFNTTTINILNKIKKLRNNGHNCYFTLDAGPHVKILCYRKDAIKLKNKLKNIHNIISINIANPGKEAYII